MVCTASTNCCNYIAWSALSSTRFGFLFRFRSRYDPDFVGDSTYFKSPRSGLVCWTRSRRNSTATANGPERVPQLLKLICRGEFFGRKPVSIAQRVEHSLLGTLLEFWEVITRFPLAGNSQYYHKLPPMNLDIFPIINKPENYRKRTSLQLILQLAAPAPSCCIRLRSHMQMGISFNYLTIGHKFSRLIQ